jgi:hypothetical protein
MKIAGWPVMPARCATCPFHPGRDQRLVNAILARTLFQASQVCHHPRLQGKKETHLCRGARDEQLILLHRLGWIEEPTDEAFAEAGAKALLKGEPSNAV